MMVKTVNRKGEWRSTNISLITLILQDACLKKHLARVYRSERGLGFLGLGKGWRMERLDWSGEKWVSKGFATKVELEELLTASDISPEHWRRELDTF